MDRRRRGSMGWGRWGGIICRVCSEKGGEMGERVIYIPRFKLVV